MAVARTKLVLIRHGEARAKEEDPQQGLSERGRAEAEAVCSVLAQTRPNLERIWHSGKRRAAQTAEILASHLGGPQPQLHLGLEPNDPVSPLVGSLGGLSGDTAIVGHLPFLHVLVSVLLGTSGGAGGAGRGGSSGGGSAASRETLLRLPPAGAVCLELEEGGLWVLRWFLTPELCLP